MRYFLTLLRMQLKSTLRSPVFLVSTGFFFALTTILAAILPQNEAVSLQAGVLTQTPAAVQTAELLFENTDYTFVEYTDQDTLERDVLKGVLHCGYLLGDNPSMTALVTDASYMRPLLDEIVLAAYFKTRMPSIASEYLAQNGFDNAQVQSDYDQLSREATPMTVILQSTGAGDVAALAQSSIQPLLYAVLVSLFLALSLLSVLLSDEGKARAAKQLAVLTRRPLATAFAPVLVNVLLHSAVLIAADALLSGFVRHSVYTGMARFAALVVLAAVTALLTLGAAPLRRSANVMLYLLPFALLVSILCSGAIVSPSMMPAGLGVLRFFSPAWYALRLITFLS
ncbi:hypothetical protein V6615_12850 [Oscillospiraceae bacterium PP1C4]